MSDFVGDIWKFADNPINFEGRDVTGDSAPPVLVGAGYSVGSSIAQGSSQRLRIGDKFLVDVINGLYWTHTPLTKREEVPYIALSEKRLKTNALIAQAAYNSMTVGLFDKTGLLQRAGRSLDSATKGQLSEALQKIQNFLQSGPTGSTIDKLGSLIGGSKEKFNNFLGGDGLFSLPQNQGSRNVLRVYEGLYITEPTGWEYVLPYFEDYQNGVSNDFGDANVGGIGEGLFAGGAASLVEGSRALAESMAGAINIMEPGTYIEKPKFYQFQDSGDEVTIQFPLLNTGHATYEDVVRNWQFIYLMVYQNRPIRFTRDLIEPPVIYEVSLPGIKYMPYAYVSRLEVQFQGSRRPMNITFKDESSLGQGQNSVNTIIPDGYSIQITLKGLVSETRNFLYTSLNADPVSVTTTGGI